MTTSGTSVWTGGVKDGRGKVSTKSGALADYPYGFGSRFDGKPGTNPEELIGAAHASCFTMSLALILNQSGLAAAELHTIAEVTLVKNDDGYAITDIHLTLRAAVPGLEQSALERFAGKAKLTCPVSKLLKANVTLDAALAA